MKRISGLSLIVLLTFGVSLYSQDISSASPPPPAVCDPDNFEPGTPLEVLSDISGVDMRQYLWDVTRKIRINWHSAILADARPPQNKKGCAAVEFAIEKDGKLAGIKLVQSSGDVGLEQAAETGITASAPFPPLPEQFTGESLVLRFHSHYNPLRGHLMPVGPQNGEESSQAGNNAGPCCVATEPSTYHGQPAYRVGHGVSIPKATYMPAPEYSDKARKKKLTGVVLLSLIVTPEGTTDDIKVTKTLGMGLDEKAIEAVSKWRFQPAMKDGSPVAVQIDVEVNFRLY